MWTVDRGYVRVSTETTFTVLQHKENQITDRGEKMCRSTGDAMLSGMTDRHKWLGTNRWWRRRWWTCRCCHWRGWWCSLWLAPKCRKRVLLIFFKPLCMDAKFEPKQKNYEHYHYFPSTSYCAFAHWIKIKYCFKNQNTRQDMVHWLLRNLLNPEFLTTFCLAYNIQPLCNHTRQ